MPSLQPLPPPGLGATLTSPEPSGWPQEDVVSHGLSSRGSTLSSGSSPIGFLYWLIFLSRLFVSIFLPFAILGPHSTFKATWLLASLRGRQVEEGQVYSLYSFLVGNSPSLFNLFTLSAPLSKKTLGTVGMHQSCR